MIYNVPKNLKVKEEKHTCEHHKRYPEDVSYAGCTCMHSWSAVFDITTPEWEGDDYAYKGI